MKPLLFVLAASVFLTWPAGGHAGQAASGCWRTPEPQTLEEIAVAAANQERLKVQRSGAGPAPKPATLALSNPSGGLKAAYGAGLLVGWGETGNRPEFSLVTAVGVSALVAPFAFLGSEGDRKIADLFACDATSLQVMAERAAGYIDAQALEKIARRHERGARLLVALPGSAARRETVWDIGAIAASRHPKAHRYIGNILLAAVDLTTFIDPVAVPVKAGALVVRNATFREIGAGEPFLSDLGAEHPYPPIYLIHNGVLFPDEGGKYMEARGKTVGGVAFRAESPVVAAYDFFLVAETRGAEVSIASPRPRLNIHQPAADFDMAYLRTLFLDAYRQGRMSREWRRTFPDRDRAPYYQ